MRKGELVIEPAKPKSGLRLFNKTVKKAMDIQKNDDGNLICLDANYRNNPSKIIDGTDEFVRLLVKDRMSGEFFELHESQHEYIYRKDRTAEFYFHTKDDHAEDRKVAFIFAKNIGMISIVRLASCLADAYGMYVASQKAINEPAKKFEDWYFDVSV